MLRYETEGPRAVLTIDDPERRNPISADVIRGHARCRAAVG